MSKIGDYYIELTEQANELGFESVEEAFANGYEVVRGELQPKEDEQTKAHKAWLKEKEDVILGLQLVMAHTNDADDMVRIARALDFVRGGEQ